MASKKYSKERICCNMISFYKNPHDFDCPPPNYEKPDDLGWTMLAKAIIANDGGLEKYIAYASRAKQKQEEWNNLPFIKRYVPNKLKKKRNKEALLKSTTSMMEIEPKAHNFIRPEEHSNPIRKTSYNQMNFMYIINKMNDAMKTKMLSPQNYSIENSPNNGSISPFQENQTEETDKEIIFPEKTPVKSLKKRRHTKSKFLKNNKQNSKWNLLSQNKTCRRPSEEQNQKKGEINDKIILQNTSRRVMLQKPNDTNNGSSNELRNHNSNSFRTARTSVYK